MILFVVFISPEETVILLGMDLVTREENEGFHTKGLKMKNTTLSSFQKIWYKSHYYTQKRKLNLFFMLIHLSTTTQKNFFKDFFLTLTTKSFPKAKMTMNKITLKIPDKKIIIFFLQMNYKVVY
jgi:hypothetical protein